MEPQLKSVAYPPGLMHRMLNIKASRQRQWREEIDPEPNRQTYSRRDLFAHFVIKYFSITKDVKSKKLIACDWSEVFNQCNKQTIATLRECRVIMNSREGSVKVVPKKAGFDIDNPHLEWACLDRIYKEYVKQFTNDFSASSSSSTLTSFSQHSSGTL